MRVCQRVWSIESAGWSADYPPECVTLVSPDVDAALQISAHRKVPGPVPEQEVREIAEESAAQFGGQLQAVSCGDFVGLAVEFVDGDTFWRRWWLTNGSTLLYVTYNTDHAHHDVHREVVDGMLTTLDAHEPESGDDAEQGDEADER